MSLSDKRSPVQKKRAPWREKNFITEVLLPSFLTRKGGTRHSPPPIFPKLKENQIGLTWIGHASFLIQTAKHNILVDPNWANWLMVIRRLKHAGMAIDHLPEIDLVLITHAHFDHLDRRTLKQIAARQPIVVPTGVGNLVHDLGFERIHEMSWWDTLSFRKLQITFVPAKHWGARTLVDHHRGYGGYVLHYQDRSLYHCGDTAYFEGFADIGERMKPEITLMPIGAYDNPSGRDHHISPEQAVLAFQELKSKKLIPMHYGTFRLSYEKPHEPPQKLMKAAAEAGVLSQVHFMVEGMPQVV
ncbi:MAG: MBL fold metallo-hydrolase [Blastochloris sp.]|nr:MBL fold metallo-hydrolase [Blastochloris sp.]